MTECLHLQEADCQIAVGQVWQRQDGSRIRVQGFSKVDDWVMVRDVGGDRERGSYPREAFFNGSFVMARETP